MRTHAMLSAAGILVLLIMEPPVAWSLALVVLVVAGVSKVVFISLVLAEAGRYLGQQVSVAVAIDSIMVALFAWYLVAAGRRKSARTIALT